MPDTGQRHRPDPQKSLVGFVVGDVNYAIDIAKVREIVNPIEVTPLPHTPSEVVGVADHRGEVLTVIDLRVRFDRAGGRAAGFAPKPSRTTKWVVVELGDHRVALVVDGVTEVFGTGGEELRPAPNVGGKRDLRGIAGVATHDGALTFVLDVGRFAEIVETLAEAGAL
jgi:purine-binding chemotaxis protein CheW